MNHEVERYVGEITELRQFRNQFVHIQSFDQWYDSVDTEFCSDYEHQADRTQMLRVWLETAYAAGQLNCINKEQEHG